MTKAKNFDAAREAILNSSPESSIYIGTDSIKYKKKGVWYAKYSTVIIIHIDSKRGGMIFHEDVDMPDYGNLKQRLINEAMYAIAAFDKIYDVIGDRKVEVHLDLNPNPKHKSNIAVSEALGYVRGQLGIEAMIKPHSWAATHAADHVVRH